MHFFVMGEPAPQPRPRAYAMRMGRKYTARMYNPDTADKWKAQVRRSAQRYRSSLNPIVCPVRLTLTFYMPRPQSHFLKSGLRPDAPMVHTGERGDVDNLCKAVMDAITDAGVWSGDGLVCQLIAEKRYPLPSQPTGCRVELEELVESKPSDHMPPSLFGGESKDAG